MAQKMSGSGKRADGAGSQSPYKKQVGSLVVTCLMPHYKANRIGSRQLFKSLARHLSHRIISSASPASSHVPPGKQSLGSTLLNSAEFDLSKPVQVD